MRKPRNRKLKCLANNYAILIESYYLNSGVLTPGLVLYVPVLLSGTREALDS